LAGELIVEHNFIDTSPLSEEARSNESFNSRVGYGFTYIKA
jgi:hypothetical protein